MERGEARSFLEAVSGVEVNKHWRYWMQSQCQPLLDIATQIFTALTVRVRDTKSKKSNRQRPIVQCISESTHDALHVPSFSSSHAEDIWTRIQR